MKRNLKTFIISLVIIGIAGYFSMYGYVKYSIYKCKNLYEQVKNFPKVYIYDTLGWKVLNPALYIEKMEYEKSLIMVCDSEEQKKNSIIYFPVQYMTMLKPIFLVGYSRDSLLAEVVDIETSCWGYVRGYVYFRNVHKTLPSDSLVREYNRFINQQNTKKQADQMYKGLSPYGIQCPGGR